MTVREHRRLCLGLLAQIYHGQLSERAQSLAIEEAIWSAEGMGLQVSRARLLKGEPIATDGNAAGDPAQS